MNLNANGSGNATLSPFAITRPWQYPILVKVTTYCGFALIVITSVVYFEIIATFIRCPRFITPFSIHVANMTIINVITTAFYDPIMLSRNLSREMFRGNEGLCGVYKYLQWTTMSMSALQHSIICVDRWLAISAPNWYRTKTVRFGVKATVAVFAYQQLWYLPLYITDMTSTQFSPSELCDYTKALLGYQQAVRIATVLLPQGFIIVSYPFLLYKIGVRTRVGVQRVLPVGRAAQRRNRPSSELRLAMWLVVLQIVFWMPVTVMSVLGNLRIALPFPDYNALAFMFATLLQIVDPLVYLVYLGGMRREIVLHLRGLLGLGNAVSLVVVDRLTSANTSHPK